MAGPSSRSLHFAPALTWKETPSASHNRPPTFKVHDGIDGEMLFNHCAQILLGSLFSIDALHKQSLVLNNPQKYIHHIQAVSAVQQRLSRSHQPLWAQMLQEGSCLPCFALLEPAAGLVREHIIMTQTNAK